MRHRRWRRRRSRWRSRCRIVYHHPEPGVLGAFHVGPAVGQAGRGPLGVAVAAHVDDAQMVAGQPAVSAGSRLGDPGAYPRPCGAEVVAVGQSPLRAGGVAAQSDQAAEVIPFSPES